MYKVKLLILIGVHVVTCYGGEPFIPKPSSIGFMVYYPSRYRGICTGTLLSRTTVITAAACVAHPTSVLPDTRPINVVTATSYRHSRRGIRVQVSTVILPKMSNLNDRGYLLQTSPALLLLLKRVPDAGAEVPLHPIGIDYTRSEDLALHEECLIAGWHFFYKGDKIYPEQRFLLSRNLRVQYMKIAKIGLWCSTLALKFQKSLSEIGYNGHIDKRANICIRDPEKTAQPCHGSYGSTLICRARVVAMLTAPDAQWTNCTGFSNIVHAFYADHLRKFFECTSKLFTPPISGQANYDWATMKKEIRSEIDEDGYDYVPSMYDKILSDDESEDD